MQKIVRLSFFVLLAALTASGLVQAQTAVPTQKTLGIASLTPQGEVARAESVQVKFDTAAIRFGDLGAPDPFTVTCSDEEVTKNGRGYWGTEKQWVYRFDESLPPGVRCTVAPVTAFTAPDGAVLDGTRSYAFHTTGPHVQRIYPSDYRRIEEEQFFLLRLSGEATPESVRQHVWCLADGVGERIPVRLIEGEQRRALLRAQGLTADAQAAALRYHALTCTRRLAENSKMWLVFGKGVATPSGIANSQEQRFAYQVREPFRARLSCPRENARSGCLPNQPVHLYFNTSVPWELARNIRLEGGGRTLQPKPQDDAVVEDVVFPAPLAAKATYVLSLPEQFVDASGRALDNASNFPLKVAVGEMPALARFAAAPFGVVERDAQGAEGPALLPVTLRAVETPAAAQAEHVKEPQNNAQERGQVRILQLQGDAQIIDWMRKVYKYHQGSVGREQARLDVLDTLPAILEEQSKTEKTSVQTRMVSLLRGRENIKTLQLPTVQGGNPRPLEVVGIPLSAGFNVVEIASPLLGQALLDERYGEQRTMYVRTSALVTNLGVHFKLGRENSVAWVTTLDKGQPVAGAQVRVSTCNGKEVGFGISNEQGLVTLEGISPDAPSCYDQGGDETTWRWRNAYFVSARTPDDMAFTWSDWRRGIEAWRFGVPTSEQADFDTIAHTVFDRTLVRAGETVSMKHVLRAQNMDGFGWPLERPQQLIITHTGSGQELKQELHWRETATGGLSAESEFTLPEAAKLGLYQVALQTGDDAYNALQTGNFRVEEFRLPVFEGHIGPVADASPLVHVQSMPADVHVGYISGGPAAQLPVKVSALVRSKHLAFEDYEDFHFESLEHADSSDTRTVADKLPLQLDANGNGRVTIEHLPTRPHAQDVVLEATYSDPNGEVQTLRSTHTLWPAAVIAGVKAQRWASAQGHLHVQALALNLNGTVRAGVPLQVHAVATSTTSSRKRMVGGFYSYDNSTHSKELGVVCSGKSDNRGLLNCKIKLEQTGDLELRVTARDSNGHEAHAATTVWVTRHGEVWFGGADHDRIDVLPEKKSYQPGETARLQVRMPFRQATAWVTVEREGVLETRVVALSGQDPTVELKIRPDWNPNVYVSVLVIRGRLHEVPWYSLFTWGLKTPRAWWNAFRGRNEYVPPAAMVDLSKPAYRMGMAELRVGDAARRLQVKVESDKPSYQVRGQAQVTLSATLPDGKPAAGAEVALAAVDQALLELKPNDSWNLLEAMLRRRAWGVKTATAQMEIIGRRHYGKKATPAGGGGGQRTHTRELLDTLLLWQPALVLDAQGQTTVTVPLNDAISTFKIVAVADTGLGLFGTGSTSINVTQDLQIISGLPPLVREGDQFRAQLTLRNTTAKAMQVQVLPRAELAGDTLALEPQTVDIAAGDAREVAWQVSVPEQTGANGAPRTTQLHWSIEARDSLGSNASDSLKFSQRLISPAPLVVTQATVVQLAPEAALHLDTAPPADALPGRGGLKISVQPTLAVGLAGVRDWWANYPFSCLEQKASKAIGLRDRSLWQTVVRQLPTYLDDDGLAHYFPPAQGAANRGSDSLTAWLLAGTHEVSQLYPEFTLPPEIRNSLERGLVQFVEGRIERKFWSPRHDLDVRKLAAIEALSRYGRAQARMLGSITIAPDRWPTHAVIDWVNILKRMPDIANRTQHLAKAMNVLQSRLFWQGTKVRFSTEDDDDWWWLMQGGDVNTARLLLTVMDDSDWRDDMGRLANGFIARQQGGAWGTTVANFWGALALEKFSARFESTPVSGTTRAASGSHSASVDWSQVQRNEPPKNQDAPTQSPWFGAPAAPDGYTNNTLFLPWSGQQQPLHVTHQGTGSPWLTLQAVAALSPSKPVSAGYRLQRTVTAVQQAKPDLPAGHYSRGDILRITLEVTPSADMTWVVVSDPIPAGASILGSGLGRDSEIAVQEQAPSWYTPAFVERSFEAFRAYYEYLPKTKVKLEYTVRLNNAGHFQLPPSRVEALYAPEMFGYVPNAPMRVVIP